MAIAVILLELHAIQLFNKSVRMLYQEAYLCRGQINFYQNTQVSKVTNGQLLFESSKALADIHLELHVIHV